MGSRSRAGAPRPLAAVPPPRGPRPQHLRRPSGAYTAPRGRCADARDPGREERQALCARRPAFNCSHSGSFVCCAVHGGPVGIDLEARRPSAPRWLRASARRRSWFSPRRAAGSTRCASCSSGPQRKHGSNTPARASASISARCPPPQQTACTKRCSAAASSRPSRRTMSSPSYTMQYKRKKQTTSQAGPRADDGVLRGAGRWYRLPAGPARYTAGCHGWTFPAFFMQPMICSHSRSGS